MYAIAVLLGWLATTIGALDDGVFDESSSIDTSVVVSGRGHHEDFNEYGFPELVFGSHAAAIAAFTYYIVIFFKTYLLIHLGLFRQREAEQLWSARHSGAEDDRYPSLDHLFE
ncbi:uncharacterized protein LOC121602360 [Anopheles merus]|uniref:uncharacterized protein LOC121594613 n=1 Tax=Anopheles merus TaxID=30066 RepID=UPI001BE4A669|nr:uncharacterized protein LOC121594613 [Anopheles merus]XP_041787073.1 uncharacterized protein LOC121602360 [Anopheles merus]